MIERKPRLTRKEQLERLRERLKGNPRALAELDMFEYRDQTDWYHQKLSKEADKIARLNRHFLR